jgi:hypothetical protein
METEKITEFWDDKAGEKELLKAKVVEADTSIKLSVKLVTEQQAKIAQIAYDKATETKLLATNHAETVVDLGSTRDFMKCGEIDYAFQNAFEQDDYRAVLQYWNAMKSSMRRRRWRSRTCCSRRSASRRTRPRCCGSSSSSLQSTCSARSYCLLHTSVYSDYFDCINFAES